MAACVVRMAAIVFFIFPEMPENLPWVVAYLWKRPTQMKEFCPEIKKQRYGNHHDGKCRL